MLRHHTRHTNLFLSFFALISHDDSSYPLRRCAVKKEHNSKNRIARQIANIGNAASFIWKFIKFVRGNFASVRSWNDGSLCCFRPKLEPSDAFYGEGNAHWPVIAAFEKLGFFRNKVLEFFRRNCSQANFIKWLYGSNHKFSINSFQLLKSEQIFRMKG